MKSRLLFLFVSIAALGVAQSVSPPDLQQLLSVDRTVEPARWSYTWWGRAGFRYVVLATPALDAGWVQLPGLSVVGGDARLGIDYETDVEMFFFRVLEYSGRSEAALADSDADGLPDIWEIAHFGDLTPAAGDDPDGDGWTNLTEFRRGGNPTRAAGAALAPALELRLAQPAA